MEMAVKAILGAVSVALVAVMSTGPALSARMPVFPIEIILNAAETAPQLADYADGDNAGAAISESEAADIAQSANPGAKVLKVKLLRRSTYAVTLKAGGNVFRVMVDAKTGAIQ
jgi:uncharacterized membrane protein YkoI